MPNVIPISASQYLAGKVRRWHTSPELNQNNADHSHGVALIIALMHPNPSANLLKSAITHDLGELITGDIPSPAKRDPVIKERMKQLESEARHSIGIPDVPLTDDERHWLAFADAYEAYLFINFIAHGSNPVNKIEHDMIQDKIFEHAAAAGINFVLENGRQPGERVQ